jgi:hypothetical protein
MGGNNVCTLGRLPYISKELVDGEAAAVVPLGRWNNTLDRIPVGIDGANGRRACDVAPVLLMADVIIPLRTPAHSVVVEGVG